MGRIIQPVKSEERPISEEILGNPPMKNVMFDLSPQDEVASIWWRPTKP